MRCPWCCLSLVFAAHIFHFHWLRAAAAMIVMYCAWRLEKLFVVCAVPTSLGSSYGEEGGEVRKEADRSGAMPAASTAVVAQVHEQRSVLCGLARIFCPYRRKNTVAVQVHVPQSRTAERYEGTLRLRVVLRKPGSKWAQVATLAVGQQQDQLTVQCVYVIVIDIIHLHGRCVRRGGQRPQGPLPRGQVGEAHGGRHGNQGAAGLVEGQPAERGGARAAGGAGQLGCGGRGKRDSRGAG